MLSIFKLGLSRRDSAPRYPADPGTPSEAFRGVPELRAERCLGHAACAGICPSDALRVEHRPGGWIWELDRASCVACGLCADECPSEAITISRTFELATRTRPALRTRVQIGEGTTEVPQ